MHGFRAVLKEERQEQEKRGWRDNSGVKNTTLSQDTGFLAPSMLAPNHLQLQFQGFPCPLPTSKGTRHAHGTPTYMQIKHPYTVSKSIILKKRIGTFSSLEVVA